MVDALVLSELRAMSGHLSAMKNAMRAALPHDKSLCLDDAPAKPVDGMSCTYELSPAERAAGLVHLNRAVEICGGITRMATAMGLKSNVVNNWRLRGQVPAERCPDIELVTGAAVRCEDLRPDVKWFVVRELGISRATAGKPRSPPPQSFCDSTTSEAA